MLAFRRVTTDPSLDEVRGLYLDLVRRSLTGALAEDSDTILGGARSRGTGILGDPDSRTARGIGSSLGKRAGHAVGRLAQRFDVEITRKRPYDPKLREEGRDWPSRAESMIGLKRMQNIQDCIEHVLADGVPGDLIETGVWRGGATIFMRAVLKAYGDTSRTVWVADSFAGLPKPNQEEFAADAGDTHWRWSGLAVGVEQVRHNFARYGLLDDQVRFLVGWFKDTLPGAPIESLSVIRLDGDMYESTWQAIEVLYPKLSPGGFCIVDDFGTHVSQAQQAVHDYRAEHGITEEIVDIDGTGAYWRKSG
jgi:O-methyltransferase